MRISGSVKDAETGAPLGGVRIYGSIGDNVIFDTSTDTRGDFNYRDQRTQYARQRLHMRAERAGYAILHKEQIIPPGELKLDFELSKEEARHAAISGSVRNRDTGWPLKGAMVTGAFGDRTLFTVQTDAEGGFCADLDASMVGQVLTIRTAHAGCAPHQDQVRLPASGLILDIELRKEKRFSVTIAGIVRAFNTKDPVRNATVRGAIGTRESFQVETNSVGEFFYSDNDRTLVGQTLVIKVKHPNFEPHTRRAPISVSGAAIEIDIEPLLMIPQLTGFDLEDATRKLVEVGLSVGSVSRASAPNHSPDTVVGTTPAAGEIASRGSSVDLIVTPAEKSQHRRRGAAMVPLVAGGGALVLAMLLYFLGLGIAVPPVVGGSVTNAVTALDKLGLNWERREEPTETMPQGSVISASPSPGEKVTKGSTVTLVIAVPVRVRVPPVAGQLPADAGSALERLGLKWDRGDYPSYTTTPGRVIGTLPGAGAMVEKGSFVKLMVAVPVP